MSEKKEKEVKTQFSVSMGKGLLDRVDKIAVRKKWPRSTTVEDIVEKYFILLDDKTSLGKETLGEVTRRYFDDLDKYDVSIELTENE